MKKGCFVKVIVILTILTAAVLYIFQHKFNEYLLEPGKKLISGLAVDEIRNEYDFVKDSPEKDSLIQMTADFVASSALQKKVSDEEFRRIKLKLDSYLADSVITREELELIKLEVKYLNERSKKD